VKLSKKNQNHAILNPKQEAEQLQMVAAILE